MIRKNETEAVITCNDREGERCREERRAAFIKKTHRVPIKDEQTMELFQHCMQNIIDRLSIGLKLL